MIFDPEQDRRAWEFRHTAPAMISQKGTPIDPEYEKLIKKAKEEWIAKQPKVDKDGYKIKWL